MQRSRIVKRDSDMFYLIWLKSYMSCVITPVAKTTCVYMLTNASSSTYIGATKDIERRLRQHNGCISGGCKQTNGRGGWSVVIQVVGFMTWRDALRFEFSWRRCCKNHRRGPLWRQEALITLLNKPRWSSTSPWASEVPLVIRTHGIDSSVLVSSKVPLYVRFEGCGDRSAKTIDNSRNTGNMVLESPSKYRPGPAAQYSHEQ